MNQPLSDSALWQHQFTFFKLILPIPEAFGRKGIQTLPYNQASPISSTGPKPDPWLSVKGPRQTPADIPLSALGTIEGDDISLFGGRQWRERPFHDGCCPLVLGLVSGTLLSRRQWCFPYSELLKRWDVVSSSIPPDISTNEKPGLLLITGKGLMKNSVFHDSFASAGTLSPPRKRAFSWVRQSSEPPVPAELAVQVSLQCCSSCIKNILRIA